MAFEPGVVALTAAVQILDIIARRGLVSLQEIEIILDELIEIADEGNPGMAALIQAQISGPFAQIRATAERAWKGP